MIESHQTILRRERSAVQQLHYAEIETLKQQHAEHTHLLKVSI